MATRDLTVRFEGLRNQVRRRPSASIGSDSGGGLGGHLLAGVDASDDDRVKTAVRLQHSLPPEWVDHVDQIEADTQSIRNKMDELRKLHDDRLQVSFGKNETELERRIELVTAETTGFFHKCENNLKQIATVGNARGTNLPQQERLVRLNVMRRLATEIQELSRSFRHQQKNFLMQLKGQQQVGREFFSDDSKEEQAALELAISEGNLSPENEQRLVVMRANANAREAEIIKIAQTINELYAVFKELSVLVVEQGSILDRIDYNVESALVKVTESNVHLKKADESSKKARSIMCIAILFLICLILSIILYYKHA